MILDEISTFKTLLKKRSLKFLCSLALIQGMIPAYSSWVYTDSMKRIKSWMDRDEKILVFYQFDKHLFEDAGKSNTRFKKDVDPIMLLEFGIGYSYGGNFSESNRVLEEA